MAGIGTRTEEEEGGANKQGEEEAVPGDEMARPQDRPPPQPQPSAASPAASAEVQASASSRAPPIRSNSRSLLSGDMPHINLSEDKEEDDDADHTNITSSNGHHDLHGDGDGEEDDEGEAASSAYAAAAAAGEEDKVLDNNKGVPQSAVLSEAEASSQSSSNLEHMWEEDDCPENHSGQHQQAQDHQHHQHQQQAQDHQQAQDGTAASPSHSKLDKADVNTDADNAHDNNAADDVHDGDAYSDVRTRLEMLSRRDRLEHAYHNDASAAREAMPAGEKEEEEAAAAAADTASAVDIPPRNHDLDLHTHIPFFAAVTTYLGYTVLIVVGHFRDVCANIFRNGRYYRSKADNPGSGIGAPPTHPHLSPSSGAESGADPSIHGSSHAGTYPSDDTRYYAPLLKSWENFYTRRLYHRIQDCFNRPIASRPGATIDVLERVSWDGNKTMEVLGSLDNLVNDGQREEYEEGEHYVSIQPGQRVGRKCLNLGSYNYLGFADDWDRTCRKGVLSSLQNLPVSVSSSRTEFGTTCLHTHVERVVANFLGKEDAVVLNMGFNTNATTIPALVDRGDLLVSDELNHTSIVNGARASGAAIRTFKHNDPDSLEEILRTAIVLGRPRTRRPWNKIMVVVEGIYSMEGEYCDLRNIVRVCKRYGAYVYLDEAHSVGAMGPTGRGCCEYTGVNPDDVDVMMGTFTKSFGGMGGYIAGSKEVVAYLRGHCAGSSYHNSLSPVVCQQIISSFEVIMGEDRTDIGKKKLTALRDNSNYFRMRLTDMGLHVLGHYDSPIMPVMLYNPTKIAAFSRECLKRGLAVVVVGFPAVPILMSRARFCISAGHTREDLDKALKEIDEIADLLKLKYAHSTFG